MLPVRTILFRRISRSTRSPRSGRPARSPATTAPASSSCTSRRMHAVENPVVYTEAYVLYVRPRTTGPATRP